MGIERTKTAYPGRGPAFYQEKAVLLPGDFAIKQTLPDGTFIPKGSPIQIDFDNMEAGLVKVAKVVAGGSTSAPRVVSGTLLQVGDVVMKLGKADASPSITAIDRSNTSYDVITLSAAIEGLTTGDFLQEATATGDVVAETKGVYTLTVGTKPAAGDKLSLDGVEYVFAAAEGDGAFAVGADAKASAANIEDAVSAQYDGVFSVVAKNGKLIFTQLTGGTGALPVLVVTPVAETGTLAATIATTTAGVAAADGSAAPKYVANAVVGLHKEIKTNNGFPTVAAAAATWVLIGGVYPIPSAWLKGFGLEFNPNILYIKQ